MSDLAAGCGFRNKDVARVIQEDNEQRRTQAQGQTSASRRDEEEEDLDVARFEPDSADELSSEEEAD